PVQIACGSACAAALNDDPTPIPAVVRCPRRDVATSATRYLLPSRRKPTDSVPKFQASCRYSEVPIFARALTIAPFPNTRSTCARVIPTLIFPTPTPRTTVDSIADAPPAAVSATARTTDATPTRTCGLCRA